MEAYSPGVGMKRDMDLVRMILLAVEAGPALAPDRLEIQTYDDDEIIAYHLLIMGEAGLLIVLDGTGLGGIDATPVRMTWAGHEFLELVRDDSRWRAVKAQTGKVGGFVFELAKLVASGMAMKQLGL